jgi:hypothetical protein
MGGLEQHHPGLPEAFEGVECQVRQGDGLGQLELALVGLESVQIELMDIFYQPLRAGNPAPVLAVERPVSSRWPG